ncbi:MAG: hypothetical protein WCR42_03745 [bacterium]
MCQPYSLNDGTNFFSWDGVPSYFILGAQPARWIPDASGMTLHAPNPIS